MISGALRREISIQFSGKPPSFSRRVIAPEFMPADALPKHIRGRAGRRGSSGPTGLDASPMSKETPIPAGIGVRC